VSNKILEDEGILGDVNVSEFPLHFLPLEDDVLSLELGDAFMELYLVSLHSMLCTSLTFSSEKGPFVDISGIESLDARPATPWILSADPWQRR
jgi:hypothetical protein